MAGTQGGKPKLYAPQQKITFDLRVCGKLCECRETWNWNQSPRQERGECRTAFSPSSRMRLLREIAQIEWLDGVRYSLLTLTYPDQCARRSIAQHTIDRSRFTRDLEQLTGRETGILWRKEWKERQSGVFKGQILPHWHLLLFDSAWIDHKDIRKLWSVVIGATGPVATDIREVKTAVQAAYYAAKYASKAPDCSLDNVSYLNSVFGRAWGFLRKHQIPYYEPTIIRDLSPEEFALAKHLASAQWRGIPRGKEQGFTLFGDCGPAIVESVRKMRLANARRAV